MKKQIYIIIPIIVAFTGVLNIYAFKSPTAIPPAGGVQAPVTTSMFEQMKAGSIGVSGVFAVFGNTFLSGGLRIVDGTQKEFYALVSDKDGNASWKPLPARPILAHKFKLAECPAGSTAMNDRGLAYCGYWVNTGLASYCRKGDARIAAIDTGTSGHKGGNHGITIVEPNGCVGWEGEGNNGGAGCSVLCRAATSYK